MRLCGIYWLIWKNQHLSNVIYPWAWYISHWFRFSLIFPSNVSWFCLSLIGLTYVFLILPLIVLCFDAVKWDCFFFFFSLSWLCCSACGSLVPWPGIEPGPRQWKHRVLTTGQPGNSQMGLMGLFLFIYLFIYGCIGSLLLLCWASHCGDFSCCGAWALGTRASVIAAHGLSSCGSRALECRLSSCGTRA